MKTLFYLISFLLISNIVYAQYPLDMKRDYIWFTGNNNQLPTEKVIKIDFNNTIPNYIALPNFLLNFNGTSTGVCDTNGRLLFYTNGQKIIDSTYQIMQNGDSMSTRYAPLGLRLTADGIAVNQPNTNKYLYISQGYNYNYPYFPRKKDTLLVSTIDMDANNGKGSVTSKNVPFFEEYSQTIGFKLCRHANGRDWWFIQPDTTYNKIYRFLITPNGLDTLAPQVLNNDPLPAHSYINFTAFSPDGNKFGATLADETGVLVYNFDRCTGLLSNLYKLDYGGCSSIKVID